MGYSFRFLDLSFREILIFFPPGGGFFSNIRTSLYICPVVFRMLVRSFAKSKPFRRFSFRLSKTFLHFAKNFSQAKLFPGKNFSGQRCGNFFFQNFFRQLSANIFSAKKLFPENFAPKTFPRLNFFRAKTFPVNVAETFFSKTFSGNFPPIFFPQKNFSRETLSQKLFPG